MKRIITYAALFLVPAMLLTACGTGKSLTQRHYNNRYYIGMSKAESTETSEIRNVEKDEKVNSTSSSALFEEAVQHEEVTVYYDTNPTELANETTQVEEKESRKLNIPSLINTSTDERKLVDQYSVSKLKNTITSKKQSANYDRSGEALSLLWIVILILIILWAFGFAFGGVSTGGLIHLLLVIALILLILWLLRVI